MDDWTCHCKEFSAILLSNLLLDIDTSIYKSHLQYFDVNTALSIIYGIVELKSEAAWDKL